METTIKDVLHLYIGCEVSKKDDTDEHYQLGGILDNETSYLRSEYSEVCVANTRFKLLLTPLSDMTEEDARELFHIVFKREFRGSMSWMGNKGFDFDPRWVLQSGLDRLGIEVSGTVWADTDLKHRKHNQHEVTLFLLRKGYDLFNLIEKGEAINKNKK